jgi:hypothetical protein
MVALSSWTLLNAYAAKAIAEVTDKPITHLIYSIRTPTTSVGPKRWAVIQSLLRMRKRFGS